MWFSSSVHTQWCKKDYKWVMRTYLLDYFLAALTGLHCEVARSQLLA